jgi:hypothetical protein
MIHIDLSGDVHGKVERWKGEKLRLVRHARPTDVFKVTAASTVRLLGRRVWWAVTNHSVRDNYREMVKDAAVLTV